MAMYENPFFLILRDSLEKHVEIVLALGSEDTQDKPFSKLDFDLRKRFDLDTNDKSPTNKDFDGDIPSMEIVLPYSETYGRLDASISRIMKEAVYDVGFNVLAWDSLTDLAGAYDGKRVAQSKLWMMEHAMPDGDDISDLFIQAVGTSDYENMTVLAARGANLDVRDNQGATLVSWAVKSKNDALLDQLLSLGADPSLLDWDNVNPIMDSIRYDNPRAFVELRSRSVPMDAPDMEGRDGKDYLSSCPVGFRDEVKRLLTARKEAALFAKEARPSDTSRKNRL